jgi:hypothetical protein
VSERVSETVSSVTVKRVLRDTKYLIMIITNVPSWFILSLAV